MSVPAVLALADGTIFRGQSIGAKGNTTGEVVFNTAMTGYQEILTDPSYSRQIVTFTYPHIGNTGTTPEDLESAIVHASGLVIRDLPLQASNWRAVNTLTEFLERSKTVAIAGIDTRRLTRMLRERGLDATQLRVAVERIVERAAHHRRRLLHDVRDRPRGRHVDRPRVGDELVPDCREQARLAAAVRPDQAELVPRVHGQACALQQAPRPAADRQVADAQHRAGP